VLLSLNGPSIMWLSVHIRKELPCQL